MLSRDLWAAGSEIVVAAGALLILLGEVATRRPQPVWAFRTAVATTVLVAFLLAAGILDRSGVYWHGTLVNDPLARLLDTVAAVVTFLVLVYTRPNLIRHGLDRAEHYFLVLTTLLGVFVVVSGGNLISLYLGLELLALSLYALIAIDRRRPLGAEAAMKYFVLGAMASALLLYAFSFLYGLAGSFRLDVVARALAAHAGSPLALAAVAFVVIALAFKFGAVPLHFWVPDVYEGAPTSVTLLVGTVPEIASIALFVRILGLGLAPVASDWTGLLVVASVLSLLVGNLLAVPQRNVRRLLGYSAVGHVGFILLAFQLAGRGGESAAVYYTIVYVLMSAAAFGGLALLEAQGVRATSVEDLGGLSSRSPWMAFFLLCALFSLAGVPPFLGFWAKLIVLRKVIAHRETTLAVFAVVMAVIAAYYYLRVVKAMYFDPPPAEETGVLKGHAAPRLGAARFWLMLNALGLLVLGIFPDGLWEACRSVVVTLLR
jgi:NADH-quinone oxidoreductase subunit N